jgi:hypothetical protein
LQGIGEGGRASHAGGASKSMGHAPSLIRVSADDGGQRVKIGTGFVNKVSDQPDDIAINTAELIHQRRLIKGSWVGAGILAGVIAAVAHHLSHP